jgi:hypothetical protein
VARIILQVEAAAVQKTNQVQRPAAMAEVEVAVLFRGAMVWLIQEVVVVQENDLAQLHQEVVVVA